jgi:hypothetical protein
MKINYPLILLDKFATEKDLLVITIAKPIISFSERRFEGNLEFVTKKFCDSNGNIFKLITIDKIKRDNNLKNWLFNDFKFHTFGEYKFRKTGEHIELECFRKQVIELMKIETIEEAWDKETGWITQATDYKGIIDVFFFGRQD